MELFMMAERRLQSRGYSKASIFICVVTVVFNSIPLFAAERGSVSEPGVFRVFSLRRISAEQGKKYLAELEIGTVSQLPSPNTLLVTAQRPELTKVSAILKLVDADEIFLIKTSNFFRSFLFS